MEMRELLPLMHRKSMRRSLMALVPTGLEKHQFVISLGTDKDEAYFKVRTTASLAKEVQTTIEIDGKTYKVKIQGNMKRIQTP